MFKLIECRNPHIRKAIMDGRRYNNLGDLDCVYYGEVKLCKWCCSKPVKTIRHSYCDHKCKLAAMVLMAPQSRQGAVYLLLRQRFICGGCDYSWKEVFRDIYSSIKKDPDFDPINLTAFRIGRYLCGLDYISHPELHQRMGIRAHRGAQVDHIIPVWEGGTSFGFENLQVLCVGCHKLKSVQETKRRVK